MSISITNNNASTKSSKTYTTTLTSQVLYKSFVISPW